MKRGRVETEKSSVSNHQLQARDFNFDYNSNNQDSSRLPALQATRPSRRLLLHRRGQQSKLVFGGRLHPRFRFRLDVYDIIVKLGNGRNTHQTHSLLHFDQQSSQSFRAALCR